MCKVWLLLVPEICRPWTFKTDFQRLGRMFVNISTVTVTVGQPNQICEQARNAFHEF